MLEVSPLVWSFSSGLALVVVSVTVDPAFGTCAITCGHVYRCRKDIGDDLNLLGITKMPFYPSTQTWRRLTHHESSSDSHLD